MMPITLVQSGRAFERNGVLVTPMAEDRRCDTCGARDAGFGETVRGVTVVFCGWVDGKPVCIRKGGAAGIGNTPGVNGLAIDDHSVRNGQQMPRGKRDVARDGHVLAVVGDHAPTDPENFSHAVERCPEIEHRDPELGVGHGDRCINGSIGDGENGRVHGVPPASESASGASDVAIRETTYPGPADLWKVA